MLCYEVYQKAGMKQLQTDACMFIHYVANILGQQELANEDLLPAGRGTGCSCILGRRSPGDEGERARREGT